MRKGVTVAATLLLFSTLFLTPATAQLFEDPPIGSTTVVIRFTKTEVVLEPFVDESVFVVVQARLQCDPTGEPPRGRHTLFANRAGWTVGPGEAVVWKVEPREITLEWTHEGDGRYAIDEVVELNLTRTEPLDEQKVVDTIWSMHDEGTYGGCTAAGYEQRVDGKQHPLKVILPPGSSSGQGGRDGESKGIPPVGPFVFAALLLVAVGLRQRREKKGE